MCNAKLFVETVMFCLKLCVCKLATSQNDRACKNVRAFSEGNLCPVLVKYTTAV